MIKQLRVGNYIKDYHKGKIIKVEPKDFCAIAEYESLFNGVFLSPQTLTKIGFKNTEKGFEMSVNNRKFIVRISIEANSMELWMDGSSLTYLNYLHELQNVIYDLTKATVEPTGGFE